VDHTRVGVRCSPLAVLLAALTLFSIWLAIPQSSAQPHAMSGEFNRALAVECTHCHAQDQWKDESKPPFAVARNMMRMVDVVNERLDGVGKVSCITCHGGQTRPSRQPRPALDEQLARWPKELADASEVMKISMAVYNVALGVECSHCHSDVWKADTKKPFRTVSLMNSLFKEFPRYMPSTARTQCFMCHKGSTKPNRE